MRNQIEQANSILDEAYATYNPVQIVALSSWGHDSLVSTDLAWKWARERGLTDQFVVITLDTGLSADGYLEWVNQQADQQSFLFEIWQNEKFGLKWYLQDALGNGFGYTPTKHSIYFQMLKERTIRLVLKHYKTQRHDCVMFVSGVYRAESLARANIDEHHKIKAAAWVAPLCHWSQSEVSLYRADNDLPINPFYETVGGSGDCQCNWGQFITLPDLKTYSAKLAGKIEAVNQEIISRHGWGYGDIPSDDLIRENKGQMVLPFVEPLCSPDLCAGCQRPKPGQREAEDMALMRELGLA